MVLHVENLKRAYQKEHAELEEVRSRYAYLLITAYLIKLMFYISLHQYSFIDIVLSM